MLLQSSCLAPYRRKVVSCRSSSDIRHLRGEPFGFFRCYALFSLFLDRGREVRAFYRGFVFFTLGYGSFFDSSLKPLVISEQSLWVEFHALFAWIAYGFHAIVFAAAIGILIKKEETVDAPSVSFSSTSPQDGARRRPFRLAHAQRPCLRIYRPDRFFVIGSYYSARLHGRWWMWTRSSISL